MEHLQKQPSFGTLIFNCVSGAFTMAALEVATAENLSDKILIDVANPLDMATADWSKGIPPQLIAEYTNHTSLAEEIQKAYPNVRVVKALNTMTNPLIGLIATGGC